MRGCRRGSDYIFFFQAEDGIRDLTVTGVQTCALPISAAPTPGAQPPAGQMPRGPLGFPITPPVGAGTTGQGFSLSVQYSGTRIRPQADTRGNLIPSQGGRQQLTLGLEIGRASCRERV